MYEETFGPVYGVTIDRPLYIYPEGPADLYYRNGPAYFAFSFFKPRGYRPMPWPVNKKTQTFYELKIIRHYSEEAGTYTIEVWIPKAGNFGAWSIYANYTGVEDHFPAFFSVARLYRAWTRHPRRAIVERSQKLRFTYQRVKFYS